jgi:hypothetical protein
MVCLKYLGCFLCEAYLDYVLELRVGRGDKRVGEKGKGTCIVAISSKDQLALSVEPTCAFSRSSESSFGPIRCNGSL